MRRRRRNDGDDDDEEEEEGGEAHLGRTMATANELPYAFPADRRGLEKKKRPLLDSISVLSAIRRAAPSAIRFVFFII